MTPLLIFLFNFNPATAIGTDILHGAIFKSFGAVRHRRLGTVRARLAGWMCWSEALRRRCSGLDRDVPDRALATASTRCRAGCSVTRSCSGAFVVKALVHPSGPAASLGRLTTRDRIVAVSIGSPAASSSG